MKPLRILLVSNGYGEIAIAGWIGGAVARLDAAAAVAHFPLVGELPNGSWPPAVGPMSLMPSGGLVTYWNFRNIARDVRAGLIGSSLRQFAFLARQRGAYDAVVAVGDAFCLAACLAFTRLGTIFVATAKSEFVAPHSPLERWIARHARETFARDALTAQALRRRGVRATYAGNVMMDGVAEGRVRLPIDEKALRVAVLPGSRADAPANARAATRRLKRIAALGARPVQAMVALAPSVNPLHVVSAIDSEGIATALTGDASGVVARGSGGGVEILLVSGGFGDVLRAADVVLGQAGTGNEQAAGFGKPVIAAAEPGETPQAVGWYRMRQQRLLGDALLVLPGDDDDGFARGVVALAADRSLMERMGAAGRARMGSPGAAAAVAQAALTLAREMR